MILPDVAPVEISVRRTPAVAERQKAVAAITRNVNPKTVGVVEIPTITVEGIQQRVSKEGSVGSRSLKLIVYFC